MDKFFYVVLTLAVAAAAVQLVYHFTSKRNPSVSKLEKSLCHFVLGTAFYAVLVLVSFLHLSTITLTTSVRLVDEPAELAVQEIVKNQERMNVGLEEFRDVLSLVLLTTGLYALSIVGILHQLWNERKKLPQDKNTARALGLELD